MLEKSLIKCDGWGFEMIKDDEFTVIGSKASFDETIKITDRMDRLLCEMKETMRTIQRNWAKKQRDSRHVFLLKIRSLIFPSEHIMQSS